MKIKAFLLTITALITSQFLPSPMQIGTHPSSLDELFRRSQKPVAHAKIVEDINVAKTTQMSQIPVKPADYVRNEAIKYGWHEGKEWEALEKLLGGESGFSPNAQNPTSTAYGMFQFLNSTWSLVGCQKTSDPKEQARCGLKYIQKVYNSPSNAYAQWMSRSPHWY